MPLYLKKECNGGTVWKGAIKQLLSSKNTQWMHVKKNPYHQALLVFHLKWPITVPPQAVINWKMIHPTCSKKLMKTRNISCLKDKAYVHISFGLKNQPVWKTGQIPYLDLLSIAWIVQR